MTNIILRLALVLLLCSACWAQYVTPTGKFSILPYDTSQGAVTSYAFFFNTDTDITDNAWVRVVFPSEFDPRKLALFTGCLYQGPGDTDYSTASCSVSYNTITIRAGSIVAGDLSVVISGVTNPTTANISSQFSIATLFQQIEVTTNAQFGQSPFSAAPATSSVGTVQNAFNTLIEQGSSWIFSFTPSQAYPANSSLRFIFPTGFQTNQITCNVTGLYNQMVDTRVLPGGNIYDCLNVNMAMAAGTAQRVVVSGVVNPNFEMTATNFKVQVLQGNGVVALETISVTGSQLISHKSLNTTLTYPNLFRNNSCVYTFQINVQSNMNFGDYIKMQWSGNWTFFLNGTYIVAGVNSNPTAGQNPNFFINYNSTSVLSTLYLRNFSSLVVGQPITFYVSLRTPLLAGSYNFLMETRRASGALVEQYSQVIPINATTAYIKQLRMHPVHQSVKLPVGLTGPLEIVLGLNYYLPNTDVLTFGRIEIVISPQIPLPPVNLNGVPKCYFFGSTPAVNCTYDVSNPLQTSIVIFTPKDFVYESSEIPVMITTEGYVNPSYQGITIDTLVKRYLFKILFYASYKSPTVPTEVLFTEWIPDPVPLTGAACTSVTRDEYEYTHLVCTFTTPLIDLCANGHVHLFTLEFLYVNSAWDYGLGWNLDTTYQDYPCLMSGANLSAVPYVKCDMITYHSGPYALQKTSPGAYINVYGFSLLPGGSSLTLEIPNIKLGGRWQYTNIRFSIQEETWGMKSPYVELYSQTLSNINYLYYSPGGYSSVGLTNSFATAYPNKNTTFTVGPFSISAANPTHFILEIDQSAFPDIGRSYRYTCGSHLCSKFNIPHQYVILYTQSNVGSSGITLTFPYIMTPAYSGTFTFKLRAIVGTDVVNKWSFSVVINPEVLSPATFQFDPAYESTTTLFPNREQFYKVLWTLKNPLPASTSSITITFSSEYTIVSSAYCLVTSPTVVAADSRGFICVVTSSNLITISNLGAAAASATFSLSTKLISSSSASSISPTVSIVTYYTGSTSVDILTGQAHTNNPISNTNLVTMSTFTVASPQILPQKLRRNYFGPIEFYFSVTSGSTGSNGYYSIFTFTSDYYPPGNALNLPLSCNINSVRYACTYTLNPLTVTITHGYVLSTTNMTLNITTYMLQPINGFYQPVNAGRYLATVEVRDYWGNTLEKGQYNYDILPDDVPLFNATFAHRDTSQYNIFTFNLRTGSTVVPAYNDASAAGRIYIGFPTSDGASTTVFDNNLGYSAGIGTILPCWFNNGSSYVQPLASTSLQCRLRPSVGAPTPVWVEIINFQAVPANGNFQIIMGRILNPAPVTVDVNFIVKINTVNPTTQVESPLYEGMHNMFFDMRSPSISLNNEVNSSTTMFQPGAKVGDLDKYITVTPYTPSTFNTGDWFIVDLDPAFQLTLTVDNCLSGFYLTCIVFPTVNWLAVQIGNGTIIPVYPHIAQLPLSISRLDTTYKCYNFISNRWTNTITYTISAAYRWQEIKGTISSFTFAVTGQQGKINTGRTSVQVLIGFVTSHLIPANGAIEIKFPANSTLVPNIKTHCRSAVTMGSKLYGQNSGKAITNLQGEVGCYVQNTYSWIITGNDALPANSQVYISGVIDMPTVATTSLGTGYVVTYLSDDSSNTFANSRIIDYTTATFQLNVNTSTWYPDESAVTFETKPLRAGWTGDLKFLVRTATSITASNGYVILYLYTQNEKSAGTGFALPSNPVCTIVRLSTSEKIGCLMAASTASYYVKYQMTPYETLTSGMDYIFTITTQNNNGNEGIPFPTSLGVYKAESTISYSSGNAQVVSNTFFLEVYGSPFTTLNFYSTVTIPGEKNLIMVEVAPTVTISTSQQLVIEIPTQSIDGTAYFADDLGMGYADYSDLVFDIYDSTSGVSSMTCKVYTGQGSQGIPVKIICSNFNTALTSATVLKFGFWVTNPSVTRSLAIPVTVYSYDQYAVTKANWNILESAFNMIVTVASPILDNGNFAYDVGTYETYPVVMSLTTRNTAAMSAGDLYIVKVGFDPRQNGLFASGFTYNSGLGATGTLYIMRNCKTYVLKVGATSLAILPSASATINAQIKNVYTPYWKPSTTESVITAYVSYLSTGTSEKITHKESLPALSPKELASPLFSFAALASNTLANQPEDYQFSFTYVNGGSSTEMQYAKMFSITFPNATTNDFGFTGTECTEGPSSGIEVQSCVIDTSNRIIWITPVQKSTYTTGTSLVIQTRNQAIRNPNTLLSVDAKSFEVRVYTWNTATQPVLLATSLNYVYLRQMSNIPSAVTTYTSLTVPVHTEFDMSHRRMVNRDIEPSNNATGTDMKTPFRFKFKNVVAFSDLTASANSHTIALNYRSSYSYTAASNVHDMQTYVPACYLNEIRIQTCTISSNTITMSFKYPFNTSQEISVVFTVLNPQNEQDSGFTYTAVGTTGTYYVGLTFTPYGSSGYYLEPEPFHPYYRTPSALATYPHFGITAATLYMGNYVVGAFNMLEFQFTFSRNDINGLVIEIPNIDNDGDIINSSPLMLGLPSGSNLPCSVGYGLSVSCYYEAGTSTDYGQPTRIYVSNFAAGSSLQLRVLITNPDQVGQWPSIFVRAMGGSYSAPNVMGTELMGRWRFPRIVKMLLNNGTYSNSWTDTTNSYPNKPLYHTNTIYYMYNNYYNIPANGYVLMAWPIHTTGQGEICDYVPNSAYGGDYFVVNYAPNNRVAYLLIKYTSGFTCPNYHTFGYLRMRHFLANSQTMYIFSNDGVARQINYALQNNNQLVSYSDNYYTVTINRMDLDSRQTSVASWHFLSVNIANMQTGVNNNILATDPADMVLSVQFDSGTIFSSLNSACSIESGVTSTDPLVTPYCELQYYGSRYQFIIRKFNKFSSSTLNLWYHANNAASSPGTTTIILRLYASTLAYNNLGNSQDWPIARSWATYTLGYINYYYSSGAYTGSAVYPSGRVQLFGSLIQNGYCYISSISASSVTFQVYTGTTIQPANNYYYRFRFYIERVTFSGSCTSNWGSCSLQADNEITVDSSSYTSWTAGTSRSVTVNVAISGLTTPYSALHAYMLFNVYTHYYYSSSSVCGSYACGCTNYCWDGNSYYYCCPNTCYYSCDRYWDWYAGLFMPAGNYYNQQTTFASSASTYYISNQYSVQTEMTFTINSFNTNVGPSYGTYLIMQWTSGTWSNGNMFLYTYANETTAKVDCKCIVGASVGVGYSTTYTDYNCYRMLPNNQLTQTTIAIEADVASGQSLKCFFPGFQTSSSASMDAFFLVANSRAPANYPWLYYTYYYVDPGSYGMNGFGSSGSFSVNEPGFLSSSYIGDQTATNYYLQLTTDSGSWNQPYIYVSYAAPIPSQSWCTNSGYNLCRVYTTYANRMYFIVAQSSSTSISQITFNPGSTATLPNSREYFSTNLNVYAAWSYHYNQGVYYYITAPGRDLSNLYADAPSLSSAPSLLSSNLPTMSATQVFSVAMGGYTFYGVNKRAAWVGSYATMVISSLTISGCAVWFSDQTDIINDAVFCTFSGSTATITTRYDVASSGTLYLVIQTGSVPTSYTATFTLYDKYRGASDYSITMSRSVGFGRGSQGSLTLLAPSKVVFRRQAYRQLRTDMSPLIYRFSNAFDYVYNETSSTSSHNLVLNYPAASGIANTYSYSCVLREYTTGAYELHNEWYPSCVYYTTNQIRVWAIPGHILRSGNKFEISIWKIDNANNTMIAVPTSNPYTVDLISKSGGTTIFQSRLSMRTYQAVNPITVSVVKYLTREAGVSNSLYIEFAINQAGTSAQQFEFKFPSLGLSNFQLNNGQELPCFIGTGFTAMTGRSVKCIATSSGINQDTPLFIRVNNMAAFTSGTTMKIAFDGFTNPPQNTLLLTPIDMTITFVDQTTKKVYVTYFPQIYVSDSVNINSAPSTLSSTYYMSSNTYGASTSHYLNFNWPQASSSSYSEKTLVAFSGGLLCCSALTSFSFTAQGYGMTVLWANTKTGTVVLSNPSALTSTGTNFYINSAVNPYPYQLTGYNTTRTLGIIIYKSYKRIAVENQTMPAWTSYAVTSNSMTLASVSSIYHKTSTNDFHNSFLVTYDFTFSFSVNDFGTRKVTYCVVVFTAGVGKIDAAYPWVTGISPYYINNVGNVKFFYTGGYWALNITGITDSVISTTQNWVVRLRFYPTGGTISYTSTAYCYNGLTEFTNSASTSILSTNGYNNSNLPATSFYLAERRYLPNNYELQIRKIQPVASSSTSRLIFRFTAAYNVSEAESFSIVLPTASATGPFVPKNTPNKLTCVINPTYRTKTDFGVGYYTTCSYSSYTYVVQAPSGGLVAGTEYSISIMEFNQFTSSFYMPTTPMRQEIVLTYNSMVGLQYFDVYKIDYPLMFSSFGISYSSLMASSGAYNVRVTLTFTFNPALTLPASVTSGSITESMLVLEVPTRYFSDDLNIPTVFTNEGLAYTNGQYYTHLATPSITNANTRFMKGQNANNNAPSRFSVTDYGAFASGTTFTFKFPLITHPTGTGTPVTYRLSLYSIANGVTYPVIYGFYQLQNINQLISGTRGQVNTDFLLSSNYVQNTMTLTFYFRSSYNMPNGYELMLKLNNGNKAAWTSINSLASPVDANFATSEYYPNINLLRIWKTTSTTDYQVSLGSYTTATDVQSFGFTFCYVQGSSVYYQGNFTSSTDTYSSNLLPATSWTSPTMTRLSGLSNYYVVNQYTISWKAASLTFPEGSYMVITFNYFTVPSPLSDQCKSISGFPAGTLATSVLLCKRYSANQIIITGYGTIAANTALSIITWLKNPSAATETVTIAVNSAANNQIISASFVPLSMSSSYNGIAYLQLKEATQVSLAPLTTTSMTVTFTLTSYPLVSGTNDYIYLNLGNWTLGTPTAEGKIIWRYKVGNWVYWVPVTITQTGTWVKVPVYSNYTMATGSLVSLYITGVLMSDYAGLKVTGTQFNYFTIQAWKNGVLVEQQNIKVWTPPTGQSTFSVSPSLTYLGATNLYTFTMTPNVAAQAGDFINIEFTTNDRLYTFFDDALGKSFTTNSFNIGCRELDGNTLISDSRLTCKLFKGSAGSQIPAVIQIAVTKAIAAGTTLTFVVLDIANPASNANQWVGFTGKLMRTCDYGDPINLCSIYESVYYMQFVSGSTPGASYTGSLSFSPARVSATPANHAFGNSYALQSGDYIKIVYYPEVTVPTSCIVAGHSCWTFPLENVLIIKLASAMNSPYSLVVQGMTNLYKYYSSYVYTEIYRGGSMLARFYTSFSLSTITTDPTTGTALSVAFTPTLTSNNYQLNINFDNIARIDISYMLQNAYVNSIWLTPPGGQIYLINTYCNATLESLSTEQTPYPYRFICTFSGSGWYQQVRLTKPANFPAWDASFISRKIIVYLRYNILSSLGANGMSNWVATAYAGTTQTTNDLISQGTGTFVIAPYVSPPISSVDFHTTSFNSRTCTINDQCMFYGYLLPSTLYSEYVIRKMVFTLPPEFKYAAITSMSACLMKGYSNVPITSCLIDRTNSTLSITYVPSSYDHNYKLITLNTASVSQLFTSPAYPGTHYQMKADLYTQILSKDVLIETMKVNLTTVFGTYLSVPDIVVKIPMDGSTYGLFDVQFLVGSSDIPPGYPSSTSNTITSQLVLIFSNSFAFDLGTGYSAGDTVACAPVSGLTFNTMDRLTCRLYPSVSSTTYPTIRVTGYDRIANSSTIRFRLAGLKTLAAGVTDYIKVGVELVYFNYGGVTGNLYEPTSVVVGPPTVAISPYAITFTVTENSTNVVGELANYTFAGTIANGFSTVSTTDYFAVQFPTDVFERNFSINAKALCSLAASQLCYSFGKASIIYFNPSTAFSSTTLNFALNNIIQAAYQFDYSNVTFTVFTIVSNKVNAKGTAVMTKFAKYSRNLSALITSIDSSYGGDNEINYYFQFQLNHLLPTNGAVAITFPKVYPTLFYLNSMCIIGSGLLSSSSLPYCTIASEYQINIYPNGVLLDPASTYTLKVTNITNPNTDLSSYNFTATSFYDSNIYSKRIVSQTSFSPPTINLIAVKNCTFQTTLTATNANITTRYSFVLICPSYIKQSSEVKVYLPWSPTLGQTNCTSNTGSLYSYQCAIKQEFVGSKAYTYLSVLVRSINAQKLFEFETNLLNPSTGSYNLTATVGYRGSVFLNGSTSVYVSALTFNSSSVPIALSVYPQNAGEAAIYVFKLPYIAMSNAPSVLSIAFPSVFTSFADLSCSYDISASNLNFSYVQLRLNQSVNALSCSSTASTITFSNISAVFADMNTTSTTFSANYFYYIVYGVINPANSFSNNFTLTYQTSTTVYWTTTQLLPFYVSSTPAYMQINKVNTSLSTYLVQASYTFQLSLPITLNIPAGTPIAVEIKWPSVYKDVWDRMPTASTVNLTLGSTVLSGPVSLATSRLFSSITVAASTSFSTVQIDLGPWRNPNSSLDCTKAPIFQIALYDYKFNNIISSTVFNNKDCVLFTNRLYTVRVEGNSVINSGTVANYTIILEKPADNLTITPSTTSSAITFEPASIVFSNYTTNVTTFVMKAAPSLTGNYTIRFTKTEGPAGTFYNDFSDMNVSVVTPSNPYYISFTPIDTKSIGLPITLPIILTPTSSNSFTLFYTHNCSDKYSLSPSSSLLIASGTNSTNISITYKGSVVPPVCAISFSLSYSNYNYQLANKTLYVAGYISTDKSSVVPPMRLVISPAVLNSTDVGKTVLTNSSSLVTRLKPIIYSLAVTDRKSNTANFSAVLTEIGTLYYVIVPAGSPETLNQSDILNASAPQQVTAGSALAQRSINIVTNFQATGLSSQSPYKIAAYLSSSVGDSDISYVRFNTTQSSNGAEMVIALSSIQTNSTVLTAVSKVLRIPLSRMAVLTFSTTLQNYSSTYNSTIMNQRSYVYTIVIAPNPTNETQSPIDLANSLRYSNDTQSALLTLLPSFRTDYPVYTREVLASKPRISKNATIPILTFDSVTIRMNFWEEAYVYAVILPVPSANLLSNQVVSGLDNANNKVVASQYVATQTNANGSVEFTINKLNGNTSYVVHISAECVLPYSPRLAMTDSEVVHLPITTYPNLNLHSSSKQLVDVLKTVDAGWSKDVEKHLQENSLRTGINNKTKSSVRVVRN